MTDLKKIISKFLLKNINNISEIDLTRYGFEVKFKNRISEKTWRKIYPEEKALNYYK